MAALHLRTMFNGVFCVYGHYLPSRLIERSFAYTYHPQALSVILVLLGLTDSANSLTR
jgi:hypothetical protein